MCNDAVSGTLELAPLDHDAFFEKNEIGQSFEYPMPCGLSI